MVYLNFNLHKNFVPQSCMKSESQRKRRESGRGWEGKSEEEREEVMK